MNNLGFNISTAMTATLGVFGMNNNDFNPTTFFFYIVGIFIISFLMGFFGEQVQIYLERTWHKFKHKNNGMGFSDRHI